MAFACRTLCCAYFWVGTALLACLTVFARSENSHLPLTSQAVAEIGGQAEITVTSYLVILPVRVSDTHGIFVAGLKSEDFRVYEDGRLQKITLFEVEDSPVAVGLVVDHSQSMGSKLPQAAAAVVAFAHSSNPQDEMFVVDFSDGVSLESQGGKPFTSDAKELERAVNAVSAEGQTALYDAVMKALDHLQLGHQKKKAIIIVSDGGDNASTHKYSQVLAAIHQSAAVIYSVALVGDPSEEENPAVLRRLSKDSGGVAFFPRAGEDIAVILKQIARDLREQYTLGYVPEKLIGGASFRKIEVKASAAGHGRLNVRTRSGYSLNDGGRKTGNPAARSERIGP